MSELLIVGSEQDNSRLDRFLADQYEAGLAGVMPLYRFHGKSV